MPLRPVLTVEVDDSQFKRFKQLFDKYNDALKALPKCWKAVAGATAAAGAAAEGLSETLEDQIRAIVAQEMSASHIEESSSTTNSHWSRIVSKFKEVDTSLQRGTAKLLKWSALTTGVIGGLSAIGLGASLWGIDRMASAVTDYRKTAMGLGMSYGQFQSANVNYSRLVSPSSLLQGISTAKYDITSPEYVALLSAGVSPHSLKYGNVGDIAADFLEKLPAQFKGAQPGMYGAIARGKGFDQIMPMNDIIAYLNASEAERKQILSKTKEDASKLDMTDDAQRKWADFTTQMGRAMKTIEATFMTKLSGIEPGLKSLSASVVKVIDALAKSGIVKTAIDDMAWGIDEFAKMIDSKEFKQGVRDWGEWIKKAAKQLWQFITGFNLISPAKAEGVPSSSFVGKNAYMYQPGDRVTASGAVMRGGVEVSPSPWTGGPFPPGPPLSGVAAEHAAFIREYAASKGIDPEFAVKLAASEGLNAWTANNPNAGSLIDRNADGTPFSFGDFQLNVNRGMGVEARRAGIDPAKGSDWKEADKFAIDYMARTGDVSPWPLTRSLGAIPRIAPRTKVVVRSSTGNDPVRAHAQASNPTAAYNP